MQCAEVIARAPSGLSTTLAVQKCWLSLPAEVVNSAPTAGAPEKAWPFREVEARWSIARTKLLAMSPAAPLAGVTMTISPTASALTSAALVGDRENQRARSRGRIWSAGAGASLRAPG